MRRLPATLARQIYAAAEPIADHGLDHTKIDDIADATGVPKATLYYHFAGKEEILSFLFAEMLSLVEGEVAVAAAAPGSACDRLTAVVKAQVKAMFDHPAVCRALLGEFGRASSLPEIAAAIRNAFHIPIERLLRDGERDGSLRHLENPADAATAVFGAVTFNALNHLVEHDQDDPQAVASAALDVLITGLRNAGSAATDPAPRATRHGTTGM